MASNDKKTASQAPDSANKGLNPIVAISIAIVIALIIAGTSLQIFLSSDSREVINIKEESVSADNTNLSEKPVETGDITTSELNTLEADIKDTAEGIRSDDFSSSEMTDAALGL